MGVGTGPCQSPVGTPFGRARTLPGGRVPRSNQGVCWMDQWWFVPSQKWRKLALFVECPKRHFSALQTPRHIGILESAMRCVRGVWLAGGAEPGAIFHRGDTSGLRVASCEVGPDARGDRHLSPLQKRTRDRFGIDEFFRSALVPRFPWPTARSGAAFRLRSHNEVGPGESRSSAPIDVDGQSRPARMERLAVLVHVSV
jgi:hypothetical protein